MKILILTNSISFSILPETVKASQYFSTRIPLPVTFEFKEVNIPLAIKSYKQVKGFNPITGQPSLINYYGLEDTVKDTCKTFITHDKYDCVVLVYNINSITVPSDGVITSWANFTGLSPKTEFIQLAVNEYIKNNDQIYIRLIHEIMHALCQPFTRQGLKIDEMDITKTGIPFYKNNYPEDLDSNFGITLFNLKPFLAPIPVIPTSSVIITRDNDNGIQITGTLVANNNGATFTCKTIERPWKNNIMNISAIPKGTYQVRYSFSPRFMKYTYEIRNVVARSGIRIHSVNYAKDLLGCIGLGNKLVDINGDKQLDIINSRTTIKMFQDFMGKKSFTLEIK